MTRELSVSLCVFVRRFTRGKKQSGTLRGRDRWKGASSCVRLSVCLSVCRSLFVVCLSEALRWFYFFVLGLKFMVVQYF
jgi:hypothetical protein